MAAELIGSLVGSVVEITVRQLGYLILYKANIDGLKKEVTKLEEKRDLLNAMVDEESRHSRDVLPGVRRWLETVEQKIEEVSEILQKDARGIHFGSNPKLRYLLSKKAKKLTSEFVMLREEGDLIISSAPTRTRRGTDFLNFTSRNRITEQVMEALRDDTTGLIGIFGTKGIGKTTTVNMIEKEVDRRKMFDKVAVVVLSDHQEPDFMKIQEEIGDALGFRVESMTETRRAKELNEKLMRKMVYHQPAGEEFKSKSVLIVFDNVSVEFDFERIGLPSPGTHKGYKIVLMSQNPGVCNAMGSQPNFEIKPLEPQEASELFWAKAGNKATDNLEKLFIEGQILAECEGLPVALVLAGAQVARGESLPWDATLQQFKNAKSSYANLASKEDKILFLLCCIFQEDCDIPIESLVRFGLALGLFNEGFITEARNAVYSSVDKLISSLLLDGSGKSQSVKMNVVHDLAMRIASEIDEHGLMSTLKWYQQPLSFEGLDPPKFLDLSIKMSTESLAQSIHLFKNLHTLSLNYCRHGGKDLSFIAELEHLEILSFAHSDVEKLTSKMGLPRTLRLLDVTKCEYLETIEPGLLSRLLQLEELYTLGSPVKWEIREEGKEATNASAAELVNLSRLTSLTIHVPLAEHLPKDLLLATNLTRFQIYIEDFSCPWDADIHGFTNRLSITGPVAYTSDHHFTNIVQPTLQAEALVNETVSAESRVRVEPIPDLMKLFQENKLVGITVFQNMSSLELFQCNDLKYLFSSPTAKSFGKLRTLKILNCEMVEEVIIVDEGEIEEGGDIFARILFPELRTLVLKHLPKLKSFCTAESISFEWPSLDTIRVKDIPSMITFASSPQLTPRLKAIHVTFLDKCWQGDLNATFKYIYNTQRDEKSVETKAIIEDGDEGTSSSLGAAA